MKQKLTSKLCCLLLAVAMCLAIPVTAAAESDTLTYLALGDSITSGYGLGSSDSCFVDLFAEEIGATTTVNAGVAGLTAADLATALTDATGTEYATYMAAISQADVITITIGGNDLMAAFYSFIAEAAQAAGYPVTAETVQSILADPTSNAAMAIALFNLMNTNDYSAQLAASTTITDACTTCVSNINTIAAAIKAVNADAVILVANQYNPYQWIGYDNISNLFATGVSAFNYTALATLGSDDYTVVDVCAAFAGSTDTLTNAVVNLASYSLNLDFHPNASGHTVIAETMATAYEALATGNTSSVDSGTSSDASSEDTSSVTSTASTSSATSTTSTTSTTGTTSTTSGSTSTTSPKTGDAANIALLFALMIASGAVILTLTYGVKRSK